MLRLNSTLDLREYRLLLIYKKVHNMNKYICIIFVLILGLVACNDEELVIEPQDPRYDLSDSSDPLQHYKHEFYKKYNVIIIDNVDTTDYKYTISSTNLDLKMKASTKSDEEKLELLQVLESSFYDKYSQDFLKSFAPVRLIIADSIGRYEKSYWTGEMEYQKVPLFVNRSIVAVSTNSEDFKVVDGEAYSIGEWGDEEAIGQQLINKIVIDNILVAQYGENWDQLFLPMFGTIRPYLYFSEWSQSYDAGFQINFDDSYYDPNDPDHPLYRPLSEYPGVQEEYTENEDVEAINAYMYQLGFPGYYEATYYGPDPGYPEWGIPPSPAFARISVWAEDLIPLWIGWSAQYDDAGKQALFSTYPNLKQNYLITKELVERYTGIEI